MTIICDVKIDVNIWTSLCQFNFFVNLLHNLGVSFFDIWHLFDNLTSFWQLDIFLIFWEQITHGPPFPMWLIPLYPIAHMAHTPCTPYPMCPCCPYPCTLYPQWASLPMGPIPPVPHCPCGPYPLCPIAHRPHTPVPHTPCTPYPLWSYCLCAPIAHVPDCPYPLYTIAPLPITRPSLGNGPYR